MDDVQRAVTAVERAGGLVTPRELAGEWQISEQALGRYIARGRFPEPVKQAGRVRLYLRGQLVTIAEGRAARIRHLLLDADDEAVDDSTLERQLHAIESWLADHA